MTKNEALQILNCQFIEEVEDAFELLLFDLKSKFLQQIPPLKLIDASIKKIERIYVAYQILHPFEPDFSPVEIKINRSDTLEKTLIYYQFFLTKIRLRISNSKDANEVIMLLKNIKLLQKELFLKLEHYSFDLDLNLKEYPIKLSDEIDVFKIQTELKDLGIQDNKISEYIRAQIQNENFNNFTALVKSVINAKQQTEFNGLRR